MARLQGEGWHGSRLRGRLRLCCTSCTRRILRCHSHCVPTPRSPHSTVPASLCSPLKMAPPAGDADGPGAWHGIGQCSGLQARSTGQHVACSAPAFSSATAPAHRPPARRPQHHTCGGLQHRNDHEKGPVQGIAESVVHSGDGNHDEDWREQRGGRVGGRMGRAHVSNRYGKVAPEHGWRGSRPPAGAAMRGSPHLWCRQPPSGTQEPGALAPRPCVRGPTPTHGALRARAAPPPAAASVLAAQAGPALRCSCCAWAGRPAGRPSASQVALPYR